MNHPSGPTTVVLKVAYIDDEPSSIGTVTEPKVPSVSSYMIVILTKPATLRESVTLSLSLGLPSKSTVGDTDYSCVTYTRLAKSQPADQDEFLPTSQTTPSGDTCTITPAPPPCKPGAALVSFRGFHGSVHSSVPPHASEIE
nr:MAG TPA: hypothetical protein [Caudoviricetes sp.]